MGREGFGRWTDSVSKLTVILSLGVLVSLSTARAEATVSDRVSGAVASPEVMTKLPPTLEKAARRWKVDSKDVTAVVIPLDRINMVPGEPAGEVEPLLSVNADRSIAPASTAKLMTTLIGLDRLGVNFRWKTDFYSDRRPDSRGRIGTLWIRGGGDPTLVLEDFALEVHRLKGNGVKYIQGNIVVDRSHFSLPKGNPAAFDGRANRPYNLLPDASIINFRNLSFEMTPIPGEKYARIVTLPVMAGVRVPKTIPLKEKGGCGNWKETIGYQMETLKNGQKRVRFTGALPKACGAKNFNVIAFEDNEYIERLFRALWQKEGGIWKGHVVSGKVPEQGVELLQRRLSPSLADTVRLVNKWSNNLIARHIFLSLGTAKMIDEEKTAKEARLAALKPGETLPEPKPEDRLHRSVEYRPSLTLEAAREEISDWLSSHGIDPSTTFIDNGSGLSRETRTTAGTMAKLLLEGWKSPAMSDFMASLPIAGVDGTMAKRKVATRYGYFKTGFLSDVRSIGGYVHAKNGRRYAVFASVHGAKNMPGGIAFLDNVILWTFNQDEADGKKVIEAVEKNNKSE